MNSPFADIGDNDFSSAFLVRLFLGSLREGAENSQSAKGIAMRFKKSGILSITAAVVTSVLISSPAHAIGEGAITVGNSVCDLATAGYGHGSATDPFTIRTPKALAEINDCSPTTPHRLKPVLHAAGNGKTVTYTVAASGDTYGVGQAVFITGNTPSGYDNMSARVISSTPTSVTVESTETGTWVSGGTIESLHDFYKITSNISLAKSTTSII